MAFDTLFGFLGELDARQLGEKVHDVLSGVFDEWADWFDEWDFAVLAQEAYKRLSAFFEGLDFTDVAARFMTALGKALGSAAVFLGTFIGEVAADVKTWFDDALRGQTWTETAQNIMQWIGEGFVKITSWVDEVFVTPFMRSLGKEDWWINLKKVAGTILENIGKGFSTLTDWVDENVVKPMGDAIATGDWDAIKSTGKTIFEVIRVNLPSAAKWAIENIIDPIGTALLGIGATLLTDNAVRLAAELGKVDEHPKRDDESKADAHDDVRDRRACGDKARCRRRRERLDEFANRAGNVR